MLHSLINCSFYTKPDSIRRFSFLINAIRQLHLYLASFNIHTNLCRDARRVFLDRSTCCQEDHASAYFLPLPTPHLLICNQLTYGEQLWVIFWQVLYPLNSWAQCACFSNMMTDDCICCQDFTLQIFIL